MTFNYDIDLGRGNQNFLRDTPSMADLRFVTDGQTPSEA